MNVACCQLPIQTLTSQALERIGTRRHPPYKTTKIPNRLRLQRDHICFALRRDNMVAGGLFEIVERAHTRASRERRVWLSGHVESPFDLSKSWLRSVSNTRHKRLPRRTERAARPYMMCCFVLKWETKHCFARETF